MRLEHLLVASLLTACGAEAAPAEAPRAARAETPAPDAAADAERAQVYALFRDDPTWAAMEAVERLVDDDLPVAAADAVRETALPAARASVERAAALEMRTAIGREAAGDLHTFARARVVALERYAAGLAMGPDPTPESLEGITAIRRMAQARLTLDARLRGPGASSP